MACESKEPVLEEIQTKIISCPWSGGFVDLSVMFRKGRGDNLLFLHGLGCSKEYFLPAYDSEDMQAYSIYTCDLPGFGDSSYSESFSGTIPDCARLIEGLLDQLQLSSIHLVCHSWGGAIGLELCRLLEGRVLSMLNLEGNLLPEDCFISRQLVEDWSEISLSASEVEKVALKLEGFDLPFEAQEFRRSDCRAILASAKSLVDASDNEELMARFCALSIPRAYVYGDKNEETAAVVALKETAVPLYRISGAGHSMMIDNVQEFYSAVRDFLSEIVIDEQDDGSGE